MSNEEVKVMLTKIQVIILVITVVMLVANKVVANTYDGYEPVKYEIIGIREVSNYPYSTDGCSKNFYTTVKYSDNQGVGYTKTFNKRLQDDFQIRCDSTDYNNYLTSDMIKTSKAQSIIMSILCVLFSLMVCVVNFPIRGRKRNDKM